MATTTPWDAQGFPSGPTGYYWECDFTSPADIDKFELTYVDGTNVDATAVIDDQIGGGLVLTNAAADDDSLQMQLRYETIRLNGLGDTVWLFGRFKVSDATQSDFAFGASIRDTTVIAGSSDLVQIRKDDGDTNIDGAVGMDISSFPGDCSQNLAMATMDTSFHTYAIRIVLDGTTLGTGVVTYYVDTVATGSNTTTAIPHNEELALYFAIQNGAAAAKVLSIDKVAIWMPGMRAA